MTEDVLNSKTPWQDLTIGGNIYNAGNAKEFKTGDWRSVTPIFKSELCKQCGLCFPVCPEDSIPVNKEKEKILIMTVVKDVAFVLKCVLLRLSK